MNDLPKYEAVILQNGVLISKFGRKIMKANRDSVLRLLRTAKGQIDGIIKMVEDDRYCVDISNQLLAAEAVLKKVNKQVISAHMKHCLMEAENEDREAKMEELIGLIDKLSK